MAISTPLDSHTRAEALGGRRDELLAQLPRKLAAAAALAYHDQELVLDEAITYAAYGHSEPIMSRDDLERVMWSAAAIHVMRALEGRNNTVRGGHKRVSDDALAHVAAADGDDPAEAAERAEQHQVLLDLAASLAAFDQRVLRVKWFSGTKEPLGYRQIARTLGITSAAARAADRAVQRRIKDFAAIYAAGRLCPTRQVEVSALAEGAASSRQVKLARAHIAHCQHCRDTYAAQLRTMRTAAFERKLASLLPAVEIQQRGRLRGAWDAVADTLTRPFTHEPAATAAQLAASGAGRGAGTIAMLKLAGACMASATAVGVCATTLVAPALNPDRPAKTSPKPAAKRPAAQERVGDHERLPTRAEQQLTPTPTPTPEPGTARRNRQTSATTQGGTGPTDHEQTPASPAPANAAPGGESEFDPTYQPSSPPQPAPAPAAPGATEFF